MTAPRELIEDLDSIPFPAWDLLPDLAKSYRPPAHTVKRFPASLIDDFPRLSGKMHLLRQQSLWEKVAGPFRGLRDPADPALAGAVRDPRVPVSGHDNFLAFRQRAVELCQRLIDEKIDVAWSGAAEST